MNTLVADNNWSFARDGNSTRKKGSKVVGGIGSAACYPPLASLKKPTEWSADEASVKHEFHRIHLAGGRKNAFIAYEFAKFITVHEYPNHDLDQPFAFTRWASFIDRSEVVAFEEREYVEYLPSDGLVHELVTAHKGALGGGLLSWLSGLNLSSDDALRTLREAVVGAMEGLAPILREDHPLGADVDIGSALRSLLVGGIATRLGRLGVHNGKRIAEGCLNELEKMLSDHKLAIDGAVVYCSRSKLYFRLVRTMRLKEIIGDGGEWSVRDVSL